METSSLDFTDHYFFTRMVLPMSTFAMAVGSWEEMVIADKKEALETRRKEQKVECTSLFMIRPLYDVAHFKGRKMSLLLQLSMPHPARRLWRTPSFKAFLPERVPSRSTPFGEIEVLHKVSPSLIL